MSAKSAPRLIRRPINALPPGRAVPPAARNGVRSAAQRGAALAVGVRRPSGGRARTPYPHTPSSTGDGLIRVRLARRPRRAWRQMLAALVGLGVGAVVLAFAVPALLFGYYRAAQRIMPRVSVAGLGLSGMRQTEAEKLLAARQERPDQVLVSNGIQQYPMGVNELGLRLDASAAARSAFQVGRTGGLVRGAEEFVIALLSGWDAPAPLAFDEAAARAGLEAIAPHLSQPPRNAGLRLEGDHFALTPGQLGYTINIEDALARLRRDPQAVLEARKLTVLPLPISPDILDATPALAEAERLLATPPSISAYDAVSNETFAWETPRAVVVGWLRVEDGPDGPHVAFDEPAIAAYLTAQGGALGGARFIDGAANAPGLAAALVNRQPFWVNVSHHPTRYTVQSGETLLKIGWKLGMPYWMIAQANPAVNPDALRAGQELIIPSKDQLLPLPVIPGKRVVISISQQRMVVYQAGQAVQQFIISTGIDRSPTQPGVFQVQTHVKDAYASVWDLNMPNFLGIYEAWPGFMNGIHGLPTLSNGRRLWANILGKPASYGCIILDLPAAQWLYDWAEDGVVVEIRE